MRTNPTTIPASKAKLLHVKWTGKGLLTFREPDSRAMGRLREIMEGMATVPIRARTQSPHKAPAATNSGPIEVILMELERVLKQDYRETRKDVKQWDGDFDYVVTSSNAHPGAVHVLTRLSHPKKGGHIFYGRTIQRVSAGSFLLWVDD